MALCTLGCYVLNAQGTPPDGTVSLPEAASVEERMHEDYGTDKIGFIRQR